MTKGLDQVDFSKIKTVLIRLDLNLDNHNGVITDTYRLKQSLPTLRFLLGKNVKIVIMSHWGRPGGKIVEELKLDKIARLLAEELEQKVLKLDDCVGQKEIIEKAKEQIILLENLRFNRLEAENDAGFAKELAVQGDVFINDAFSVCHRAHASVEAITKHITSVAGPLLKNELSSLNKALKPSSPAVLILGGAKLDTKLPVVDNLLDSYDRLLIGGALANSLLKAKGVDVKNSLAEECPLEVKRVVDNPKIVLPIDYVWHQERIVDIGPKTINSFKESIRNASTVVWNGPLGLYEQKPYDTGTQEVGNCLLESKAFSILGGGDTIDSLNNLDIFGKINHVSTAGGAMLFLLAGEELPGLKALAK